MNNLTEQDIVSNEKSVIIKPTGLCNAACKFCYAVDFAKNAMSVDYFDEKFILYIEENDIKSIILTGGEITLVKNFLKEACIYAEKHDMSVSLVSNLIDIINNRAYWEKFFIEHPYLFLTASYQVDTQRQDITGNMIPLDKYLDFVNWYSKTLNKRLLTISVLNTENEDTILENLKLAKKYGYICSIERQIGIGRASDKEYFPLSYYKVLNKIFEENLWKYEKHTRLFVEAGMYDVKYCNLYCKRMVPVIYINKNNELVETFCDHLATTKFDYRDYIKTKPLTKQCYFCKYYNLCQGCHITRYNLKNIYNETEENISIYCTELKKELQKLETNVMEIRGKNGKEDLY